MNHKQTRSEIIGTAIAIGAGGGVALGLVMMQIFDHNGFFALGIAIGMTLGIMIGALVARNAEE